MLLPERPGAIDQHRDHAYPAFQPGLDLEPHVVIGVIESAASLLIGQGGPIYSAELVWDDGSAQLAELAARSHADRLPVVIMPDGDAAGVREFGPDTRAVALRFRDAAGVIWLRGPEGELVDISGSAKSADPGT